MTAMEVLGNLQQATLLQQDSQRPVTGEQDNTCSLLQPPSAKQAVVLRHPCSRPHATDSLLAHPTTAPMCSCPADQTVDEVLALAKTKHKHKQDRLMDAATREAIRQKIAASMAKKAAKTRYNCPACGVLITRVGGILLHMDRCCPDLLTQEDRSQVGGGVLQQHTQTVFTG